MRAVVQERYGSPGNLEVREVDKPVAGVDEVLVRVRAASLHPDVWHVVSGRPFVLRLTGAGLSKPKNPIPGTDMARVVESVGEGVARFHPDDPVFGETIVTHQWFHGGAFAEFVPVRQDLLALTPDNVTFEQAAAVPASGFIALTNLRGVSRLRPEQKVLINSGRGGVGSLALQITKTSGAHVTAVDSASKLGMLRSLFVKQLRGPGLPLPSKKESIASLRELLESGKITPIIDSTYPLSEFREAFRHMIEDETQGRVIITPREP